MHISGPNGLNGTATSVGKKRKANATGANKAFMPEDSSEEQASVLSTAPIQSIGVVLAAQTIEEQDTPAQGRERGEKLLKFLDDIKKALLLGSISPNEIKEMQQELKNCKALSCDPKLNVIIKEIEIRLSVELAKMMVM